MSVNVTHFIFSYLEANCAIDALYLLSLLTFIITLYQNYLLNWNR